MVSWYKFLQMYNIFANLTHRSPIKNVTTFLQTSPIVFDKHEPMACVLTLLSGAETRRWRALLAREQRASAFHTAKKKSHGSNGKIKSNIISPFRQAEQYVHDTLTEPGIGAVRQLRAASRVVSP